MSNVVDNRVVEMRFDNQQFENNVRTSMSTLEKLKQSLKLTDAAKGLDNVGNATKRVDMATLGSAVDSVRAKFSALQVVAVTTLANITNSAVNAGRRLISAFTIEPVKTGLQEYETQINAVQTILANTASKGTKLKDVNAALDELNHYADKTIYNFTEMTRNIGTFTAAGIDLDTSVNAIQGIANLAAVSGSTSQQASTAMYQLSQALATGTIRLMDWNSVVNAGMGGQVFQDALKKTSEELGTGAEAAIKAQGSFRESLQTGWLTSEVLTETLKKFTTSGANEYVAEYCGITADAVQAALDAAEAQYGEADAIDKASEALAKKTGKSKDEIKSALEFAKTAEDAATKVKTFSQLMDTLKEAAQSGWTQTWEILIGDFEEAKALWTDVSNYFGGAIDAMSKARNDVLEAWAKAGGRTMAIDAIKNAFNGLLSILKPIKEAFKEVFPPITAKHLLKLTEGIRDLTAKFKLSDSQAAKLKATFKAIFTVIKAVLNIIIVLAGGIIKLVSSFSFLIDIALTITSAIGKVVNKFGEFVSKTNLVGAAINGITGFIQNGVKSVKKFFGSFDGNFDISGFEKLKGILSSIWNFVKNLASSTKDVLSGIFNFETITAGLKALNAAITTGALLTVKKFITGFTTDIGSKFKEIPGFMDNVKDVLDTVRGSLEEWQNNLKAGTLQKIAIAIGVLAAALLVLSTIEPGKLAAALGAITVLFLDLSLAMAALSKVDIKTAALTKMAVAMIAVSAAILILASAVRLMGSLNWNELAKGLIGTIALLGSVVGASILLSTYGGEIKKGAFQLVILAAAIKLLASACVDMSALSWSGLAKGLAGIGILLASVAIFLNNTSFSIKSAVAAVGIVLIANAIKILADATSVFSKMNWGGIAKGLAAIGGLLVELSIFSSVTNSSGTIILTAASLVIVASAMQKLAGVLTIFGGMSLKDIGKSLTIMALALVEIGIAMSLMPKNMAITGVGLLIVASALSTLASVLSQMGGMSWSEIGKGLAVLGGSIIILAIGLEAMTGTLAGSAALIVAALAIAILAPALQMLGEMSVNGIIKSLLAVAGAFVVIGAASAVLAPLIPAILALSIAVGIFGAACLAVGAGIALLASGLVMLAAVAPAQVASIIASLVMLAEGLGSIITAVCNAIVSSAGAIGSAIKALISSLIDIIIECAPMLINGALKLINQLLTALIFYGPQIGNKLILIFMQALSILSSKADKITDAIVTFIVSAINAISGKVGEIITACVQILESIIQGLISVIAPLIEQVITPLISAISNAISSVVTAFIPLLELIVPILNSVTLMIQQFGLSIAQTFQMIASVITTAGLAISTVISTVFSGISEIIISIGESINTVLGSVSNIITSIGTAALNAGTGFEKLANGIATITSLNLADMGASLLAVSKGLGSIASKSKELKEAASAVKTIGTELSKVGSSFKTLSNDVSNVVSKLNSIGTVAGTSMSSAAKSANTLVKSLTSVKGVVSSFASSVSSSMSSMMKSISSAMNSSGKQISSTLTSTLKTALSKIKSMASQFSAVGKSLMSKLVTGIKSAKGSVTSAVTSIVSSAASKIRGFYGSFSSAGGYLGSGLVAGINSKKTAAYNAGYALGQAAVQGEKDGQASKSPSKLTIKAGKWFGEGLVIGIQRMNNKVYNAGYKLGDTAITSLSNSINDIVTLFNDDMDFTPTIRPVVDMSDVKSNVGIINDLFSMDQSMGVLANTRAITALVNGNQNGATNDDVVAALGELGHQISGMSNTTYNVNGVTYDDGSNISDAVRTLVRAARVERRV